MEYFIGNTVKGIYYIYWVVWRKWREQLAAEYCGTATDRSKQFIQNSFI